MFFDKNLFCRDFPSGLSCYSQNQKVPQVQTPLGAQLGLEIQPPYEGSYKNCYNALINIGLVRLSPRQWSKVDCQAASEQGFFTEIYFRLLVKKNFCGNLFSQEGSKIFWLNNFHKFRLSSKKRAKISSCEIFFH